MFETLRDTLLSRDPVQQGRLKVWALGALTYLLCSGVQALEVHFGLMERRVSDPLIVAMLGSALVFYAVFRSGLNRRVRHESSLTLAQLVIGCSFSLWSYAVTGPARGAILLILISNMVYGAFSLTPRQSRGLAGAALAGLAGVMAWRSQGAAAVYAWRLELVHFLFAAIVMWSMSSLSVQLSALRARLGRQARELTQAMEQLRLLATRDELTQIHNRRHMSELMAIEARQHERSGAPMCVALLDLDLFKGINDRHGHAAGDRVLQRFASIAQEVLRTSDLLCRWGGEEFLVLFPDTPVDLAHVALQRLHQRLAREEIEVLGTGRRVTFSAGLTSWVPGEAVEQTTERADQAMYAAKSGGRNRTVVSASPAGPPRELVGIALQVTHPALAQHWQ
jgi:diguanylate cyclase (GGDEF)-like protein